MSDHRRSKLLKAVVLTMFFLTLGSAHAETPVVVDLITFTVHIEGKDYRLEAKIYKPEDSDRHPMVVMTHGRVGPTPARNPKEVNNYAPICTALAAKGYVVTMVVRRGYGNSDGYGFWDSGEYRDSTVSRTCWRQGLGGHREVPPDPTGRPAGQDRHHGSFTRRLGCSGVLHN